MRAFHHPQKGPGYQPTPLIFPIGSLSLHSLGWTCLCAVYHGYLQPDTLWPAYCQQTPVLLENCKAILTRACLDKIASYPSLTELIPCSICLSLLACHNMYCRSFVTLDKSTGNEHYPIQNVINMMAVMGLSIC